MPAPLREVRYAVRKLARTPGFTLPAVLVLAVGIGANTSIFTLLNALLLRPPPFEEPERVVRLEDGWVGSYPDYIYYRDHQDVFSGLAAYASPPLNLSSADEMEIVQGQIVSGNFFAVLGVKAALGRVLTPDDDRNPGAHPVAVLSDALWRRRFRSDPGVLGRAITLNGHSFTVVGVASKKFTGPDVGFPADLWVPLMMYAQVLPLPPDLMGILLRNPGTKYFGILGRLGPGVSAAQAEAVINTLYQRFETTYRRADEVARQRVNVLLAGESELASRAAGPMTFLAVAVGLVLLIACANVANLLLARAAECRREVAIRSALGAGRWRLVRQFLTESLLLSLLGGGGGLLLTLWLVPLSDRYLAPVWREFARRTVALDLTLDLRVCGFTLALALLTGLASGIGPAIQGSRLDLASALKEGSRGAARFRIASLRNTFVMTQVAVSLVLLIGAGLFIRSLQKLLAVELGFKPERVLLVSLDLSLSRGYDKTKGRLFFRELVERVSGLPGVEAADVAVQVPLPTSGSRRMMTQASVDGARPATMDYNSVGPRYLEAMGVPILRGRAFAAHDRAVAIVNEALARQYFPGQNPLGKQLAVHGKSYEIIGVAKDARYRSLTAEEPRPRFFLLYQQDIFNPRMTLHVRTTGDPRALITAVLGEVRALSRQLPVLETRTLAEQIGNYLWRQQAGAKILSVLGLIGALLAVGGLYGVMAHGVTRRTHEIGIRVALGAGQGEVIRMVVAQGMAVAAAGIVAGLALSVPLTRLIASLLYGIRPLDAATYAVAALLLCAAALAACCIPARRAARVDPMVALRYE